MLRTESPPKGIEENQHKRLWSEGIRWRSCNAEKIRCTAEMQVGIVLMFSSAILCNSCEPKFRVTKSSHR
jgi:hypothetical protein